MIILHIASIRNKSCTGVGVAVPQYIRAQSSSQTVGLLNLINTKIDNIDYQMHYEKNFSLNSLIPPFQNPNLAVFHDVYHIEYLKIANQLRKNKIPYVILPHGSLAKEAQKKKWLKKKIANLLLFHKFIRNASGIQFVSEKEQQNTRLKRKCFIATNGVFIPSAKKQSFSNTGTAFLYIGRLETYIKGIDLLLDAVSICARNMRDTGSTLRIYGPDYKGRYANVHQMIVERDLNDIVSLHPKITGNEKERVLLQSDIFIQTSRSEGMPLGILEALSYGLPCLITDGTNLGEILKENNAGWCAQTDAESIAVQMKQAIQERNLWRKKGENGRKLVEDNFSWDLVITSTLKQYNKIIHETIS